MGGAWQRVQLMAGWVARYKAFASARDLVVSSSDCRWHGGRGMAASTTHGRLGGQI